MGAGFVWIGLDWSLDQGNLIGANIAPEGGEWGPDWFGLESGSGQPDRRQYCAGGRRMGAGLVCLTAWLGECSVSLPCAFCPVATPLPPPTPPNPLLVLFLNRFPVSIGNRK